MLDIEVTLGRLEERLDSIKHSLEEIKTRLDRQNGRVDRLEQWRDKTIGGLAVVALLASLIGGIIVKLMG